MRADKETGEAHLHHYCYDTLRHSNRNACPVCKESFADRPPKAVGEDAVPRAEDEWRGGGAGKRKRASKGCQSAANGDEEVDKDELEDEEADGVEDSVQNVGAGPVRPPTDGRERGRHR